MELYLTAENARNIENCEVNLLTVTIVIYRKSLECKPIIRFHNWQLDPVLESERQSTDDEGAGVGGDY